MLSTTVFEGRDARVLELLDEARVTFGAHSAPSSSSSQPSPARWSGVSPLVHGYSREDASDESESGSSGEEDLEESDRWHADVPSLKNTHPSMLQTRRVVNVLVVSSLYDYFQFESDGGLAAALHFEYHSLHLRVLPPRLVRVSTFEEALEALADPSQQWDLAICFIRLHAAAVWSFLNRVHELRCDVPVMLLASNQRELALLDPRVDAACRVNLHKTRGWEQRTERTSVTVEEGMWSWPFIWQGDCRLILSMIKTVEDRLNARLDTSRADVPVIVFVEDNVQFYSSYLPLLYTSVFDLVRSVLQDGLSRQQRAMGLRTRPKILLATTWEEGMMLCEQFQGHLLGIISDVGFPRAGVHHETAGLDLVAHWRKRLPRLPILVQSAVPENATRAHALGARFAWKHDPNLLGRLRKFLTHSLGFGPFVWTNAKDLSGADGLPASSSSASAPTTAAIPHVNRATIARSRNFSEFAEAVRSVPDASLRYHGVRRHFATWFLARGEFHLATHANDLSQRWLENAAVPMEASVQADAAAPLGEAEGVRLAAFRSELLRLLESRRKRMRVGVVEEFNEATFDEESAYCSIGTGSLGGKGRCLAFFKWVLDTHDVQSLFPGVSLQIPATLVLTTSVFDEFMQNNELWPVVLGGVVSDEHEDENDPSASTTVAADRNDHAIKRAFDAAELPQHVVQSLSTFLARTRCPLAVRSSSLFEDAIYKPYAGIYETKMLVNDQPSLELRLAALVRAVKQVLASTFTNDAVEYALRSGNRPEEEKMAVVIQRLAGAPRDALGNTSATEEAAAEGSQEAVGETRGARYFAPDLAGVARAIDFFAKDGVDPEGGMVSFALGLGGLVVDGGWCARFSPAAPHRSFFHATQEKKLVMALSEEDRTESSSPLVYLPVPPAANDAHVTIYTPPPEVDGSCAAGKRARLLRLLDVHGNVHSYPVGQGSAAKGSSVESADPPAVPSSEGRKVTLEDLAQGESFPLSPLLSLLLKIGSTTMDCPVEIEFALTFSPEQAPLFSVLQMRPMVREVRESRRIGQLLHHLPEDSSVICSSSRALGHGRYPNICDVIYVDSRSGMGFDRLRTQEYADIIGRITEQLSSEGRKYMLIGPGRWGTSTPMYGIPVQWKQIANAQCIVETDIDRVCMASQGSHFFQNITSFGIAYLTVNLSEHDGSVNFDWLREQEHTPLSEDVVRHVHFDKPLQIVVDGHTRLAAVLTPSSSLDAVEQADAFLSMPE